MANTFKYLVKALVRDKGMMVWTLAFPIILSTCFIFMFAGLDDMGQEGAVRAVAVEDATYADDATFQAFIQGMEEGEDGSDGLLAVTFAPSRSQALALLEEGNAGSADDNGNGDNDNGNGEPFIGVVQLGEDGVPQVTLAPQGGDASATMEDVYGSILVSVMDTYASRRQLATDLLQKDPAVLADAAVTDALAKADSITQKISLTHHAPTESVRYYFALLGFAAMMGAQTSLIAVLWLLPRTSALGARRAVGGISRLRSLAGTLAACWAVSFACLLVAYGYMRLVAGIDFAGRDLGCIGALAASSIMAVALGAAVAVLPRIDAGAKSGILTALVCVAALFAGLYGQPTMDLADQVAAACPVSQWVNPAVQVSQAMFSLMYYDSLGPYFSHIVALLVMAAILFACSAAALRRQRYASL